MDFPATTHGGPVTLPLARTGLDAKQQLRAKLRALRREHVAAISGQTRGLLFLRPPGPIAALAPEGTTVGLYHALPAEAPAHGYARWFFENGRKIALPWFAERGAAMRYRFWRDPYDEDDLEGGPYGALQPRSDAPEAGPATVFVPLVGFTARGERLGQGGGHYDRWLGEHPDVTPIGLAWDCQLVETLPVEPHDRRLRAVVTPTRFYDGEH